MLVDSNRQEFLLELIASFDIKVIVVTLTDPAYGPEPFGVLFCFKESIVVSDYCALPQEALFLNKLRHPPTNKADVVLLAVRLRLYWGARPIGDR